ncbi:MAG: S41 family peptidase [Bacteriovoracaceae bacterium]
MKLKAAHLLPLILLSSQAFALRTPEEMWKDTGLNFNTYIYGEITPSNCIKNAKEVLACAATLNLIKNSGKDKKQILVKLDLDSSEVKILEEDLSNLSPKDFYNAYKNYMNELYKQAKAAESYLQLKKFPITEELKSFEISIKDKPEYSAIAASVYNSYLEFAADPHSYIKTIEEFEEDSKPSQSNKGIGIQYKPIKDKGLVITEIFPNSPAAKRGLKRGDLINSVNDVAEFKKLPETLFKNDKLEIQVLRGKKQIKFKFEKQNYQIDQVYASIIRNNNKSYGYIKLRSYMSEDSCENIYGAALQMIDQKVQGFILDLRDNGGGRVDQAQCIMSLFLEQGSVIWANQFKGKGDDTIYLDLDYENHPRPLSQYHNVVLINGYSASASEATSIFLKDYRKAYIVGENSFGKGSMQGIGMSEKNDKIAEAHTKGIYFGPKGISPQVIGVRPDFEVYPLVDQDKPTPFEREKDLYLVPIGVDEANPDDYIEEDRKHEVKLIQDCVGDSTKKIYNQVSEVEQWLFDNQLEYGKKVIDCAIQNEIPVYRGLSIPRVESHNYMVVTPNDILPMNPEE